MLVDINNEFKDIKSFELTVNNSNNEIKRIFCNVIKIKNNQLILESDNKKNMNIFLSVGDKANLHIYTKNGVYSAVSIIISVKKERFSTNYIIQYPKDVKHSQKREYFRTDLEITFKMKILQNNEKDNFFIIESKTLDICAKGISYISSTPFPENTSIKLRLFFKEKIIKTFAQLVYSSQIVINNELKFIHGLALTMISQKDMDFIGKKCFLYQLDLKKKENAQLFGR
jgi:c-di-GMP-binding flagellar brake protein YcgR